MSVFRRFWVVMGRGAPVYKHDSEQAARSEAKRLASQNPDIEFHVLEAIAKCVKSDVEWSSPTDSDDVPF